jgi:hypothetical protein
MSRLTVMAAVMAASLSGFALSTAAAVADDTRAQAQWDSYGSRHGSPYDGVNRYCPPGQIPHSFPNGNGIRCETQDGDWR